MAAREYIRAIGVLLCLGVLAGFVRAEDEELNLTFSPNHGSMLGGAELLVIRPQNWADMTVDDVICRFDDVILVRGKFENNMVYCVSPTLFKIGAIKAELSINAGLTYTYTGYYVAVLHERTDPGVIRLNTDEARWTKPGSYVHFQWDSTKLADTHVNIEVIGYEENEAAGTVALTYWQRLPGGTRISNSGFFELKADPNEDAPFDIGLIRIVPHQLDVSEGELGVVALWSDVHMLAYLQTEYFIYNRGYYSEQKCKAWYSSDGDKPDFMGGLEKCPCTLEQMLVDTMRYQPDIDCNINGDQSCPKNTGAVHCARAIFVGSDGGGQQCCYGDDHELFMNDNSIYGGRPDRAHVWGTNPMAGPGLVPTLSHWVSDEAPWYYCCHWSSECWRYTALRQSGDCYGYTSPGHGAGFGDPHFKTFDGLGYTMNGRGEFYVMRSQDRKFSIQGRMETFETLEGEEANATMFTALAAKAENSDTVEIRVDLANDGKSVVLVNGKVLKFESGVSWLDMTGVSVSSEDDYTYNLMFKDGVAIATRSSQYGLNFRVSIHPDTYWENTLGLLGLWNADPQDDFSLDDGTRVSTNAAGDTIYLRFGLSWMTGEDDSIFSYDLGTSHHFYYYPDYDPVFDTPVGFNVSQLDLMKCNGYDECVYDVMITRDLNIAEYTAQALLDYDEAVADSKEVVSCPYIPRPVGGTKEGSSFLPGATVKFTCDDEHIMYGSSGRTCMGDGGWTGSSTYCISKLTAAAIVGIVIALLIFIFLIVVLIVFLIKKRNKSRKGSGEQSATYEKTEGGGDVTLETQPEVKMADPEAAETMA